MNNIEKIIAKINADTDVQIAQITSDTEKELAALRSGLDKAVADLTAETEVQAKKEADAILSRAKASASMKSREILLQKKADLMDQVYCQAENAVYNLPDDEYTALLTKLTVDAVRERLDTVRSLRAQYGEEELAAEDTGCFSVVLSAQDKEKYGAAVVNAAQNILNRSGQDTPVLSLAAETAQITGGVIVRYGDIETCCSIAALIAAVREKTDTKIAALLFG